jgi:hypothetical protein
VLIRQLTKGAPLERKNETINKDTFLANC